MSTAGDPRRGPRPAGSPRSTIRDVAAAAGVHPGTASRALNPATADMVNEATAKRVRQAARQLAYRPNLTARWLKTRRSDTIGVLIPDLTNPLFPPIVRGIEDRLAEEQLVPLLGNTDNDQARELLVLERMHARQVDGFILATASRDRALPVDAGVDDVPVVLVNRVSEDGRTPSASVDDVAGMRAVVAHLAGLGHRRIAHVAGPQSLSTGHNRLDGFIAGMRAAGLAVADDDVILTEVFSEAEGLRAATELLGRSTGATAIVAANDSLALGVYRALDDAGLACPAEVSVTGFNDAALVDRLRPPLTTVRVPHYEMGLQAAQLMVERLAGGGGATSKAVLLPPELVVRGSTGPVRPRAGRPSSRRRGGGAGR